MFKLCYCLITLHKGSANSVEIRPNVAIGGLKCVGLIIFEIT